MREEDNKHLGIKREEYARTTILISLVKWRQSCFSQKERKKERKALKNEDLISTFYGRTTEHLDRVNTANMSK